MEQQKNEVLPGTLNLIETDTRTPEELLDFIEGKGWEVAEALATLRSQGR